MQITQHFHTPIESDFARIADWIVILPAAALSGAWPDFSYAEVMRRRYARRYGDSPAEEVLYLELPNAPGTRVALALLAEGSDAYTQLTWGRKLCAALKDHHPEQLGIYLPGFAEARQARLAENLLAAVLAAAAKLPNYKSAQKPHPELGRVEFFGMAAQQDFTATQAIDAGNALARGLSMLPANHLTPAEYRQRLEHLAEEHGWAMRFYDQDLLRDMGAGAFLAVARGSRDPHAGIAHLRYHPARPNGKKLGLVGKGVCFDTGGYQVKPFKSMLDMHEDMQGSAVALGILLALSRLQVDFQIDCWLALARNEISATAYTPNEVVTACNGVSIETVHTDAEGRMVLADTLALACREAPDLLIDYATLTGSCVAALGARYSGFFTNRPAWIPSLTDAGQASGERVWPFPMDADYDEGLDSKIADVKQCSLENDADHILAARFLGRFVTPAQPWVHLDLSSSRCKDGLAHIPSDTTGFGVRYTVHLLLRTDFWQNV